MQRIHRLICWLVVLLIASALLQFERKQLSTLVEEARPLAAMAAALTIAGDDLAGLEAKPTLTNVNLLGVEAYNFDGLVVWAKPLLDSAEIAVQLDDSSASQSDLDQIWDHYGFQRFQSLGGAIPIGSSGHDYPEILRASLASALSVATDEWCPNQTGLRAGLMVIRIEDQFTPVNISNVDRHPSGCLFRREPRGGIEPVPYLALNVAMMEMSRIAQQQGIIAQDWGATYLILRAREKAQRIKLPGLELDVSVQESHSALALIGLGIILWLALIVRALESDNGSQESLAHLLSTVPRSIKSVSDVTGWMEISLLIAFYILAFSTPTSLWLFVERSWPSLMGLVLSVTITIDAAFRFTNIVQQILTRYAGERAGIRHAHNTKSTLKWTYWD